mmetsp:Transcript_8854/g.21500  ORF Transcript_8854/g.21500 Transcript_8854/m.21500 type:complete len:805 (+) Transcript_8854:84-2498(+)
MGRYRRGHRHRKGHGWNRKKGENDGDGNVSFSPQMIEADWILLEKYLVEYRSSAYAVYQSKQQTDHSIQHERTQFNSASVMIGIHKFLPLTLELCKCPYVDLPATLSPKERRRVHELCVSLDLFHDSIGGDSVSANTSETVAIIGKTSENSCTTNHTRRIVISIFADGFEFVPRIGSSRGAFDRPQSFPSRTCRPWYYRAYDESTNNNDVKKLTEDQSGLFKRRIHTIELEKRQIRQFVNLPEKSLRTSDGVDHSFCDKLDFSVLDSMDLSMVPTPEETPWMLVDSVDKLKICAHELEFGVDGNDDGSVKSPKIHELAFDMEMHSVGEGRNTNKSGIRTCLIQLTSDVVAAVPNEQGAGSKEVNKDYIIDPLAPGMWDAIPIYLGKLFADPKIVKIGHGIGGMDVQSLHRDFGILIVNAFDTFEASTILSQKKGGLGLATLCRHYGLPRWEHYQGLKHQYQRSDWRMRPLDGGALEYGRYDTRYLTTLRKLLMRDLAKLDMLRSGGLRRFSSGLEDGSSFSSTLAKNGNGEAPVLRPVYSQLESTVSSATSSFSEYEVNTASSKKSLEQFKDDGESSDDVVKDSVDPSLALSSSKPTIQASEFPCYHHLMKAISMSQKRCLKLWTGDEDEIILKNPTLLSMIKQAATQRGHGKHWSDAHTKLYERLAYWRVDTARKEFNSVSEVCSLDFLVNVAFKLPKNRVEMRRYSYRLPALLDDENLPYCNELCGLVTSSALFQNKQNASLFDVVFYSDYCAGDIAKEQVVGLNGKVHTVGIERKRQLYRLLVVSTSIAVIAIVMSKARKR